MREAGLRLAASLGLSIRFLLRRLLRTLADVWAERVEARLLLVVQRIAELLESRTHDPYRVERCADAARHRPQPPGWRHPIGIGAGLFEPLGSPSPTALQSI